MGLTTGTALAATALAIRFPTSTELRPAAHASTLPALASATGRFALELHGSASGASARAWAEHDRQRAVLAHLLRSAWPGVTLEQVPVTLPAPPAAGFECRLLREPALPLGPLDTSPAISPVDGVLHLVSELGNEDHLLLQIVLSALRDKKWPQRALALARRIRWEARGPSDKHLAAAIEAKAESRQLLAAVRVAVGAPTSARARQLLEQLKAALGYGTSYNRLVPSAPGGRGDFLHRLEERLPGELPLSVPEICMLWGPGSGKRAAPALASGPSALIPVPSRRPPCPGSAVSRSTDGAASVLIPLEGPTPTLVILGETGSGKTTLCEHLIVQLVQAGFGLAFIDPKGGHVPRLERLLSPLRPGGVLTVDPARAEPPFGLDLIKFAQSAPNPDLFVEYVTAIIRHASVNTGFGPRQEGLVRCACKLLVEIPGSSLLDLPSLLLDQDWRRERLPLARDEEARAFIELQLDRQSRSEALAAALPVVNAIAPIISNPFIRHLLRAEPQLDVRRLIDENGVLLVNAAEGQLGTQASDLLTALVPSIIQLTAAGRAGRVPAGRRDFVLVIDEAHRLPGPIIARITSEARAYGVKVVLITQFLNQVPPEARSALHGNAGGWIVFRVGVEDARLLAEKLGEPLKAEDLMRQENFRATVRLALPGWMPPPFTLWTDPPFEVPEPALVLSEGPRQIVEVPPLPALAAPARAPVLGRRKRPDVDED